MKALPPGLLKRAANGSRTGVADAYRQAAAWLKAGKAPPPDLSDWLADRLVALSVALRDRGDKKKHDILSAVGAVEAGKRGRKSASPMDAALKKMLVWDCYYERRQGGTWDAVYKRVVAKHARARHFVSQAEVERCWKQRKIIAPEIPDTRG